jgi:nucleolar complex protein 2
VSKSQLAENGFKDAAMEQIYCGVFEYLNAISHKISFPEIVVPLTFQIKAFLKQCHVANYCKKLKQVIFHFVIFLSKGLSINMSKENSFK